MNHIFFFLIGFTFYLLTNPVEAATVYIPMPQGATLANGTDVHFRYPFSSDVYEAAYPRETSIPTSKGRVPMVVEHGIKPNIPRLGGAVTKLLKTAPVVGTVLTLAEIACELSDICKNPENGELEKKLEDAPLNTDKVATYQAQGVSPTTDPVAFCIASHSYRYPNQNPPYPRYHSTVVNPVDKSANCRMKYDDYHEIFDVMFGPQLSCPAGYFAVGSQCEATPETLATRYRPLTPSDWDSAEPSLSVPEVIPELVKNGQPVPIDVPALRPKEQIIERELTTVRDSAGTATGTQERTTRVKIEPLPNPLPTKAESPAKVTETTIITTTNIVNNTTNTTETTNETTPDNEPPKEEEETDIEFDEVEDNELEEFETPDTFQHTSWGSGSCLPDPVISYSHGSLTIPFHIACDFASMLRGIVLALASLTAAFIIVGARKNGAD